MGLVNVVTSVQGPPTGQSSTEDDSTHNSQNNFLRAKLTSKMTFYNTLIDNILSDNNIENYVHAKITGRLLFLCKLNLHQSICTTLLCEILFKESS